MSLMDLHISIDEAKRAEVKALFSEFYPDKNIEWVDSAFAIETKIDFGYGTIMDALQSICDKIPEITSVSAYYTYEVREDDYSANWWGSTTISSKLVDGRLVLSESSSTSWN